MKETDDISNGWFIGQPIGAIWNYKVIGIWQKDEAEEAKNMGNDLEIPKFGTTQLMTKSMQMVVQLLSTIMTTRFLWDKPLLPITGLSATNLYCSKT